MLVCYKAFFIIINATFSNISVILRRSVLLMEETGGPVENHRPAASHFQICHLMLYQVHLTMNGFRTHKVNSDGH